jgi:hypothetical protein
MADPGRQTKEDATDNTADRAQGRAAARESQEDNQAQRQSDAASDAASERQLVEASDREDGRGSSANGTPAFDEVEGAERRRLYKEGAEIVSRID